MPPIHTRLAAATLCASLMSCSNFNPLGQQASSQMAKNLSGLSPNASTPVVVERKGNYQSRVTEIEADDERDTLKMSASNASWYGLLRALAAKQGLTVAVLEGVDTSKHINLEINGLTPIQAIHQIAYLAGFVAAVNPADRSVTIAEVGNYTFKLPPDVMRHLMATYNSSSSPSGASSSASGASSGSSASTTASSSTSASSSGSTSSTTATFKINGSSGIDSSASLQAYLVKIAGANTSIDIYSNAGLINARGNAQSLKRLHEFLQAFVADAMRQAEVEISLLQVQITDDLRTGIKWDKVLSSSGSSVSYDTTSALSGAVAGTTPIASLSITTASITSVLSALEQFGKVNVMTRPNLLATNHVPTTLLSGQQIPYLPSVTNTVTGTSGTSTTSGTASYVTDGISLSLIPDILDGNLIQLLIQPVSTNVGQMQTFLSGQITAPKLNTQQIFSTPLIPNDRTVIIGGNRSSNFNGSTQGFPGLARVPVLGSILSGTNNQDNASELVMLVHARILPAPRFETLVAESI